MREFRLISFLLLSLLLELLSLSILLCTILNRGVQLTSFLFFSQTDFVCFFDFCFGMLFLYDMRFSALTRGDCLGQFLLFKQFIGSHFIIFNFNLITYRYWVLPYLVLSVMTSTFHDGIAKMSWETRELDMSSTTKAGAKTFITV
jgi:hypothetical protein